MGGGRVKAGHLGISEERVWPPDTTEHLVADTQLFVAGPAEVESKLITNDLE